jgi:high-affinity Fe2+/Pb2+ permease
LESKGWQVIIGLILGGVIAAPIAALINKIKGKPMMILVGILIIILSLRTLSNYYNEYSNYNGFIRKTASFSLEETLSFGSSV